MERIILASGSPRRRQLLEWAEVPFDVFVKETAETWPAGLATADVPVHIARNKALAVREILANGQREAWKDTVGPVNTGKQQTHRAEKLHEKSPHINGILKEPSIAESKAASLATTMSSAVKPPGSVLRPAQPTPTQDQRRRPDTRQNLDQDSSSVDAEGEEEFLP